MADTGARPYHELVAAEIRAVMGRLDLTQTALAERLGRTQVWVSRRVKGRVPIDVDALDEIAAVLDVPLTDLLPRVDSNHQPAGFESAELAIAV